MNENIDLTKILEGCPVGTKLYSSIFGEVSFVEMHNSYDKYPIKLQACNKFTHLMVEVNYADDGRSSYAFDGECTLFPSKEQRDWSKFVRFWDKPKVERFNLNTLQPFDKVLIRNYDGCVWDPSFFGYKTDEDLICIVALNVQYIPYNEETKHLIGTKEDCPKYYKWWEE